MVYQYTLQIPFLTTIIVLSSLALPHPFPTANENDNIEEPEDLTLSETTTETDSLILDLEKYVSSIPITKLDGNALLVQYLDYINGIVTYRLLDKERSSYSIYNTLLIKNVTKEKDSFVLSEGQDLIRTFTTKRQFVGLRRANIEGRSIFFVFYIYLKDAFPGDKNKKTIEGKQYTLELDFWDHRGGLEYRSQLFGWTTCEDSIYIACKSQESIKDFPISEVKTKKAGRNYPKHSLNDEFSFITQPGFDSNSEIDFFYDLDPSPITIQYIKQKISFLTKQAKTQFSDDQGRSLSSKKSKSKQKKSSSDDGRSIIGGIITGIAGTIIGGVNLAAGKIYRFGVGLVKSFHGLFGGLGTGTATVEGVLGNTIDEEVSQPGWLNDDEMAALIAEVQESTSGGLGGMINPDEDPKEENVTETEFEKSSDSKISDGLKGFIDKTGRSFQKPGADGEFPDTMPKKLVDRIVDNSLLAQVDTFIHPGWKTLRKKKFTNKVTLTHETDPFVGLGPCPYVKITIDSLESATLTEEVLMVYMSTLRTQCIKVTKARLSTLVKEGYLVIQGDNSLVLRGDLKELSEDLIPISSLRKLGQALELAAFSKVFNQQLRNLTTSKSPESPDGNPISRSVFTLGQVVQEGLEMIKKIAQTHSIRLRRNILKTLQTFFIKLVQDGMILQDCTECKQDKEINYNDKLYVVGLRQFIFRGLGPTLSGKFKAMGVSKALRLFLENNQYNVEAKLKLFD